MWKRQSARFSIAILVAIFAAGLALGQPRAVDGGEHGSLVNRAYPQQSIHVARTMIMVDGRTAGAYGGQTPFVEQSVPQPPMPGTIDAVATDAVPAGEIPEPLAPKSHSSPMPEQLIKPARTGTAQADPAYEFQPDVLIADGTAVFEDDGTTWLAEKPDAVETPDMPQTPNTVSRCRSRHNCGECYRCTGKLLPEVPRGGLFRDVTVGGWLAQGITVQDRLARDRFNGPVTFNDRDGEYQMNQLWFYAEKETNTGGCGWDVGGRIDFLYGTDHRFTTANGLDDNWNQSRRFYGAALPQIYMDVAVNSLTVRMGHFYTIIGYEVVPATDNFFYSHTYAMQYGEPFTHTGMLATYELDKRLTVSGGFGRGWDNWEDNNSDLSLLGGITATSCDGRTALSLALSTGNYDDAGELNRTMYSLVFSRQVSRRFSYVIQYDWGRDEEGGVPGFDGTWYGINNQMFYCINNQWEIGLRLEWFRDADGTRVGGIGAPRGWDAGPDIANNQIGWAGTFWEITLGANWSPCDNVVVRPECRWDWYSGQSAFGGVLPYNSGRSLDQFTFATDVVISF